MAIVLCNSGPLMVPGKLHQLDVLAGLFNEVLIPRAVYDEVVSRGLVRGAPDASTVRLFWLSQQWPIVDVAEELLSAYRPDVVLDPGETEVLALALSFANPPVLPTTKSHVPKPGECTRNRVVR